MQMQTSSRYFSHTLCHSIYDVYRSTRTGLRYRYHRTNGIEKTYIKLTSQLRILTVHVPSTRLSYRSRWFAYTHLNHCYSTFIRGKTSLNVVETILTILSARCFHDSSNLSLNIAWVGNNPVFILITKCHSLQFIYKQLISSSDPFLTGIIPGSRTQYIPYDDAFLNGNTARVLFLFCLTVSSSLRTIFILATRFWNFSNSFDMA